MKRQIEILPPMMPNFAKARGSESTFDIGQFTKEEAEAFGEMMKDEFMRHWKKRNDVLTGEHLRQMYPHAK